MQPEKTIYCDKKNKFCDIKKSGFCANKRLSFCHTKKSINQKLDFKHEVFANYVLMLCYTLKKYIFYKLEFYNRDSVL